MNPLFACLCRAQIPSFSVRHFPYCNSLHPIISSTVVANGHFSHLGSQSLSRFPLTASLVKCIYVKCMHDTWVRNVLCHRLLHGVWGLKFPKLNHNFSIWEKCHLKSGSDGAFRKASNCPNLFFFLEHWPWVTVEETED